jgi:hypothetical protein
MKERQMTTSFQVFPVAMALGAIERSGRRRRRREKLFFFSIWLPNYLIF